MTEPTVVTKPSAIYFTISLCTDLIGTEQNLPCGKAIAFAKTVKTYAAHNG
jgi:hypothetical protein